MSSVILMRRLLEATHRWGLAASGASRVLRELNLHSRVQGGDMGWSGQWPVT